MQLLLVLCTKIARYGSDQRYYSWLGKCLKEPKMTAGDGPLRVLILYVSDCWNNGRSGRSLWNHNPPNRFWEKRKIQGLYFWSAFASKWTNYSPGWIEITIFHPLLIKKYQFVPPTLYLICKQLFHVTLLALSLFKVNYISNNTTNRIWGV